MQSDAPVGHVVVWQACGSSLRRVAVRRPKGAGPGSSVHECGRCDAEFQAFSDTRGRGASRDLATFVPRSPGTVPQGRAEAVQAYGATDEADRAAYAALKQKFEKCGVQWIVKTDSIT